jgi:hypothetical protein
MVVDGARETVGSDRANVLAALHDARPESVAPVTFAVDRRSVTIGAGDGRGSVLLVRFAQERTTRVAGGENTRRTLQDANAVESLTSLGSWDGSLLRFAIEPPAAGEGVAPCLFRRPMAECSARPRQNESACRRDEWSA